MPVSLRAFRNVVSRWRHPGLVSEDPAARHFSVGQLQRRRAWRDRLRSSGEAARIESLRQRHAGQRCFIIGNGPSIKQQDLSRLGDEVTFVTNWFANHEDYDQIRPDYYCISSHEVFGGWDAAEPSFDATMREAIVSRQWRSHHFFPLLAREAMIGDPDFGQDRCHFLVFERPKTTIEARGTLNWDLTGCLDDGYTGITTFCIPLAVHMGFTEIVLLGCDCDYGIQSAKDPKAYFYDFAKHTTKTTSYNTLDRIWGPGGAIFQIYEIVRREAEAQGVRIVNATAGGLLEVFERVEYESLLS